MQNCVSRLLWKYPILLSEQCHAHLYLGVFSHVFSFVWHSLKFCQIIWEVFLHLQLAFLPLSEIRPFTYLYNTLSMLYYKCFVTFPIQCIRQCLVRNWHSKMFAKYLCLHTKRDIIN